MKTIAILTPKTDTFSNPTLTILIEKLLEQKYKILFYGSEQMIAPEEINKKLSYYPLPFFFYKFRNNVTSIKKLLKQYYDLYKSLKSENNVKVMICVDPMGLVIAGRVRKLFKFKLIYASFEIFIREEFASDPKVILKDLEIKYSKDVDLVLIQDERRKKLLSETVDFRDSVEYVNIPVSPKRIEINSDRNKLKAELNIPAEKTIVVYSGTLRKWSGINEILDLFNDKWSPDFWLVIHTHSILEEGDELKKRIDCLISKGKNISFHNKPFDDFKDYAEFLSGCDIGIATYFPDDNDIFAGKNIKEIGLSSGKFSTYMMLGIPTVTTSNSMYRELNDQYNFGEVIENTGEIPAALISIKNNYAQKSAGCNAMYESELNPEKKLQTLMNYIEENTPDIRS